MATIQLQPPEQFDFNNPDSGKHQKRCFEQYRAASGLATENKLQQVSTQLYCMGEDAESVLTSTGTWDADKKVMSKLDEYFKVQKNTIYEQARFNCRDQWEGESIEKYL